MYKYTSINIILAIMLLACSKQSEKKDAEVIEEMLGNVLRKQGYGVWYN